MSKTTLELPLAGMTCVGCARRSESALSRQAGVISSTVDFPSSQVSVTFDDNQIDQAIVVRTIREAGFEVVQAQVGQSLEEAVQTANLLETSRQWSRLQVGATLTVPLFVPEHGTGLWCVGSLGAFSLGELADVRVSYSRANLRGLGILSQCFQFTETPLR